MGVVNCRRHRIVPAGADALTAYTKPLLDPAKTTCRSKPADRDGVDIQRRSVQMRRISDAVDRHESNCGEFQIGPNAPPETFAGVRTVSREIQPVRCGSPWNVRTLYCARALLIAQRETTSGTHGLRQLLQTLLQMLQCRFQLLPVTRMCSRFDILENSLARQLQTLPLALHADLLFRWVNPMLGGTLGFCGLHLRLD